jgi:hypothetical protein
LSTHLHLGRPSGLFPSGFPTNRGNKYWEKTCPSASSPTTNRTWPELGSNMGHRSGT